MMVTDRQKFIKLLEYYYTPICKEDKEVKTNIIKLFTKHYNNLGKIISESPV